MTVHEFSATAAVDPEVVWDRWTRIDAWPVDSPNIVRARLNGPVAQGAVGWVKPQHGPRVPFRIVEVNRVAGHFEIEAKVFLGRVTVERDMTRSDVDADGRQEWTLTHKVTFSGPLARVWDWVIGRDLPRTLPGVLDNVVAVSAL